MVKMEMRKLEKLMEEDVNRGVIRHQKKKKRHGTKWDGNGTKNSLSVILNESCKLQVRKQYPVCNFPKFGKFNILRNDHCLSFYLAVSISTQSMTLQLICFHGKY